MRIFGLFVLMSLTVLSHGSLGSISAAMAEPERTDISFEKSKTASKAGGARNHTAGTRTNTFSARGFVRFYNKEKGFGFITPEGGGTDVFVRKEALDKIGVEFLTRGDCVTYELEEDSNGKYQAVNLLLCD